MYPTFTTFESPIEAQRYAFILEITPEIALSLELTWEYFASCLEGLKTRSGFRLKE